MTLGLSNVVYGAVGSLIVLFLVFVTLDHGVDRARIKGRPKFRLRSVLQTREGYYSLTQLQIMCWTTIFVFSILWVYLVRVQGDVLGFLPNLPTNTLALMGINVASAVANAKIPKRRQPQSKNFWSMLISGEEIDLTRVQFFLWTVVSILIYLTQLIATMLGSYYFGFTSIPLDKLTIPDVDPSLVILMGFSHGAYLGVKYVKQPK